MTIVEKRAYIKKFEKLTDYMESDLFLAASKGANFLIALGLVIYTEVIGSFISNKKKKPDCFNKFFVRLGPAYKKLVYGKKLNVYKNVRCGLAHDGLIGGKFRIINIDSEEEIKMGIGYQKNTTRKRWDDLAKKKIRQFATQCPYDGLSYDEQRKVWSFFWCRYYYDFIKARKKYIRDLRLSLKKGVNRDLLSRFLRRAKKIELESFTF